MARAFSGGTLWMGGHSSLMRCRLLLQSQDCEYFKKTASRMYQLDTGNVEQIYRFTMSLYQEEALYMNVLAVGCHPDDLEIGCGGTLHKYVMDGHHVTMCVIANGNRGHAIIMPDELRAVRHGEAQSAAYVLGAELVELDVPDLEVDSYDNSCVEKLVEAIRTCKPDVIITHSPDDYMKDHIEVSCLVMDASFSASVPHFATGSPCGIAPIYFMDTLAGVGFLPEEYVDITATIERKIAALEMHESQVKWMRDHDGIDFAEFVRVCSRFRGLQSGCIYAEGFRAYRAWPRLSPKRLLP
jgi:N-acetylglucosamine malate deacetylase 1